MSTQSSTADSTSEGSTSAVTSLYPSLCIRATLIRRRLQVALSSAQRSGLGITHVLSVCPDYPAKPEDTHHLCIPVQDSEFENLLIHLPIACRFIQDALDAGGKVLVHCVMGVSRSATVVCAYRTSPRPCLCPSVSVSLPPLSNEKPKIIRDQSYRVPEG